MSAESFVHRHPVRFNDLDAFGHVNNAVYLTYLEEARIAFLEHLGLVRELADMAIILARAEIDFRSPARAGEELDIAVRATRLGTKSFELAYEVASGGRLLAEARSVQVGYDYARRETVAIPETWRRKLA